MVQALEAAQAPELDPGRARIHPAVMGLALILAAAVLVGCSVVLARSASAAPSASSWALALPKRRLPVPPHLALPTS